MTNTSLESMFADVTADSNEESDFLTLKVGKNTVRLLTDFSRVENIFKGKYPNSTYQGMNYAGRKLAPDESATIQGWTWVIDRATGELKIGQFPQSILKQLIALKADPEYNFTSFPAPYDITINNTGKGADRYSIIASRTNVPVTNEEMALLNEKKPVKDIIALILAKQTQPAEAKTATAVDYPENKLGETNWGVDDLPM